MQLPFATAFTFRDLYGSVLRGRLLGFHADAGAFGQRPVHLDPAFARQVDITGVSAALVAPEHRIAGHAKAAAHIHAAAVAGCLVVGNRAAVGLGGVAVNRAALQDQFAAGGGRRNGVEESFPLS